MTHEKDILFRPEWGTFDLACGDKVVSVFGGAADRKSYVAETGGFKQSPMNPKSNLTPENEQLNHYYGEIRKHREGAPDLARLVDLEAMIADEYPADWLSRLEILEILALHKLAHPTARALKKRLEKSLAQISKSPGGPKKLITRGLNQLKETP